MALAPANSPQQAELTDSPWFWVCVFSAMALAGTIAIAPKYETRQRQIELRYEARQRSTEFAAQLAAADGNKSQVIAERQGQGDAAYVSLDDDRRELIVRLTPMLAFLSVAFVGSLIRLCWIEARADKKRLLGGSRSVVLVLAIVLCGAMLYAIRYSYTMGGFARAEKTILLFLIGSVLVALAASTLWRAKRAEAVGAD